MLSNRYVKWGGIIVFLILANIINYLYWNWGLITVKVTDAPLGKIIRSIEWQGWVTIYTNLPLDEKVSMYVDHVPLAEAMETLAANVSGPPMGDAGGPDRRRGDAPTPTGSPGGSGGGPPPPSNFSGPGGPPSGAPGGNGFSRGGRGGRGGFGGGGFGGGGAQWNLAFFIAPTSSQVKEEIRAFQEGDRDDDTRIYNYPTPLQMIATDSEMPAADPRRQSWPGIKPATDSPPPVTPAADASTPAGDSPAADTTPTVQTYLQAFAQSSDIWIMVPGSWAPDIASAPPPNSSIISAIKSFVSHSHGAVAQAIILRVGRGGTRTPGGGGFGNMEAMEDRMRNAINGLPSDVRGDAMDQLNQEVQFYKDVRTAPPEQQMTMIRQHMMQKMAEGNNNWRRSPEKRAQRYQRVVANRIATVGQK